LKSKNVAEIYPYHYTALKAKINLCVVLRVREVAADIRINFLDITSNDLVNSV
jgi:hypothetical protein